MAETVSRNHTLKTLLFVDFFNAMKENDPTIINCTEDELEELANEYFSKVKTKRDQQDTQLRKLMVDLTILEVCLGIFKNGYDGEMYPLLKSFGISFYPDTIEDGLLQILSKIKEYQQKYVVLKAQNVQPKSDFTGEDVLAQLSVGLEMKLDFNQVTVIEYISYSKALKRKNDAQKQQFKKKK